MSDEIFGDVDVNFVHFYWVSLDAMTPSVWQSMTEAARDDWIDYRDRVHGEIAAACMMCGFPVHFGGAPCEACEPGEFKRWARTPAQKA